MPEREAEAEHGQLRREPRFARRRRWAAAAAHDRLGEAVLRRVDEAVDPCDERTVRLAGGRAAAQPLEVEVEREHEREDDEAREREPRPDRKPSAAKRAASTSRSDSESR